MDLDQEICAACRRPRDEREIQAGYDAVHERDARRRRRPRVAAAWVLAAAAIGLIFRNRAAFFDLLAPWRAELSQEIEKASDPGPGAPKTAAGAAIIAMMKPPQPPAPPPASAARAAGASSPAAPTAPAAPPPPRPFVRPAVMPDHPAPGNIVIYGVVYDLATNRAIPGATVTLRSADARSGFSAATNDDGYYAIQMSLANRFGDYVATVKADGYREGQLEDPSLPYRDRSEQQRLEELAELSDRDLDPVPVRFKADAEYYALDLVMAPNTASPTP